MNRGDRREYKGYGVWQEGYPYGWWVAVRPGCLTMRATTLEGIKQLVTYYLANRPNPYTDDC